MTPHLPVSRLVCDRFRMGPSYTNWRPRGSEDWLLIYTEDGSGQFKTRRGLFQTNPGDVVLYAPGDMQDYQTSPTAPQWELSWVHFHPRQHWDKFLQWPLHENGLRFLALAGHENRADFATALHGVLDFARRTLPGALDFASASLEQALLWCYVAASQTGEAPSDHRVRQAADYLASHLSEPFHLEKLAAQCNLSVSRLSHLFKDQMGITPQQFQEQHRMRHACHLLSLTSLSVAEVAREVGYEDPFYFSNRFRRNQGESPLRYRQNKQRSG